MNQKTPVIQAKLPGACKIGIGASQPPKKRTVDIQDTKIILAYSAKKKNANRIPLYSVKNPATSDDSSSDRSKGNLFVSAKAQIKNIIILIQEIRV